MKSIPRIRVFAGPNGSGKSTLKGLLSKDWCGVYINADDVERAIQIQGRLRLSDFNVDITQEQLSSFLFSSDLLRAQGLTDSAKVITVADGCIHFNGLEVNSYFASVLSDLIRRQLLSRGESFTFETVMSSPDKVDLMCSAQRLGYRTYLYYVATEDPTVNIARL